MKGKKNNKEFLDSLFKLDDSKSKSKKKKKKRDKKLKAKKKAEVEIESEPKATVKPAQVVSTQPPKEPTQSKAIKKIFDEVEEESKATQFNSSSVDPYKKLNIKRDKKAPTAREKIMGIMDPAVMHLYDTNFKNSAFLLENYIGPAQGASDSVVPLKRKKSFKGILKPSKSDIKRSHIFDIHPEEITFEDMIPMTMMWKEYIKDLLGDMSKMTKGDISQKFSVLFKVSRCDLHGAVISIFEAKNKSLVGIEGIVIKESRHTFTII